MAHKVFNPEEESRDLGFGSALSKRGGLRLLNRDGSFNVERRETGVWSRLGNYQSLISMPWPKFWLLLLGYYFAFNLLFAGLFLLCGPHALKSDTPEDPFQKAFFFSVHTFSTIGYGNIVPATLAANMLVTVEVFLGLMSVALATGLLFARFSRPTMDILYSRVAVVAPYRGITAFMFRIVNKRDNQLIDLKIRVVFSRFEQDGGTKIRRYHQLRLEREDVAFFPLALTVVHPIDEDSPIWGWTHEQMIEAQAEYYVLLTATEETFSETVHSRSSYTEEETVWNARFRPIFVDDGKNRPRLDWERFHAIEPVSPARAEITS